MSLCDTPKHENDPSVEIFGAAEGGKESRTLLIPGRTRFFASLRDDKNRRACHIDTNWARRLRAPEVSSFPATAWPGPPRCQQG